VGQSVVCVHPHDPPAPASAPVTHFAPAVPEHAAHMPPGAPHVGVAVSETAHVEELGSQHVPLQSCVVEHDDVQVCVLWLHEFPAGQSLAWLHPHAVPMQL